MADLEESGYNENLEFGSGVSSDLATLGDGGPGIGSSSSNELQNPTLNVVGASEIQGGDLIDGINIARRSHIRGGQTDWNEGEGFWLGWYQPGMDYRFSIGEGSTGNNFMTWDGTDFAVSGDLATQLTFEAGAAIDQGAAVCVAEIEFNKLVATEDARVLESAGTTNYGTDTTAVIGSTNASNTGKSEFFVKFDVSNIGSSDSETNAVIRLAVDSYNTDLGSSYEFQVHEVTSSWTEGAVTWNTKPSYSATAETSTWEIATTWALTDDFLEESAGLHYAYINISSLYRDWQDGTSTNNGVVIRLVDRGTGAEDTGAIINGTVRTSEHATTATRPTLLVGQLSPDVGKVYESNTNEFKTSFGQLGIAKNAALTGENVTVQFSGKASPILSGLTKGKRYRILNSDGAVAFGSPLGYGQMGIALDSDTLLLNINATNRKLFDEFEMTASGATAIDISNTLIIPAPFIPSQIIFQGVITYNNVDRSHVTGTWTASTGNLSSGYDNTTGTYYSSNRLAVDDIAGATIRMHVQSTSSSGVILQIAISTDGTQGGIKGSFLFAE